jgi:hypothetical protein
MKLIKTFALMKTTKLSENIILIKNQATCLKRDACWQNNLKKFIQQFDSKQKATLKKV